MSNGYGETFGSGTKIVKRESEGSETKAHIFQAFIFAICGDVVCLCLLIIVALAGWPVISPALALAVVLGAIFALWFLKVPSFFVITVPLWRVRFRPFSIRYAPRTMALSHEIVLKMSAILAAVIGLAFGKMAWRWVTADGALGKLIVEIGRVFMFPWYVVAVAGITQVVFLARKQTTAGFALILCALTSYGIYAINISSGIAQNWALFMSRARYVAIPFVVPWPIASLLLMAVEAKNLLFPYLDFNLRPIGLDEVRELGLIGLWFPKLMGGPTKEPMPDRLIKVEVSERGGKTRRYANLPSIPEVLEFCKVVNAGAPFSLREARGVGLSRRLFEQIRDTFLDRGWAQWTNPRAKRQGVELLVAGRRVVENIALDRSVN